MLNNGSATTNDDKSPWAQPGFIAAGAVVALLVVLGLILAVTGGPNDAGAGAANQPPPAAPPVAPRPADTNESACGLDAGDQSVPKAPPSAKWKLRGSLAVPSAAAFGPHSVVAGIPGCFAHSPTGAVFANVNIYAALSDFAKRPPRNPKTVLEQLVASGPGRDAAVSRAGNSSAGSDSSSAGVQVAGFNVVRYEPSTAVIDLAFRVDRTGVNGWVHAASTMRWEEGDWKITLSQDGQPFDSMQQIGGLTGYIPWSGV